MKNLRRKRAQLAVMLPHRRGRGGPLDDVGEADPVLEREIVLPARRARQKTGSAETLVELLAELALVVTCRDARRCGVDPDADSTEAGPEQVFERLNLLTHPVLGDGVAHASIVGKRRPRPVYDSRAAPSLPFASS